MSQKINLKRGMNLKNITKLLVLACLLFAVTLSGCLGGNDKIDNNTPNNTTNSVANNATNNIITNDEANDTTNDAANYTTNNTNTAETSSEIDAKLSENNTLLTFTSDAGRITGKDWELWELTEDESGILSKTSDSYASGRHMWSFKGEKSGTVRLEFMYYQSMNTGKIETYTIEVYDDKSMAIVDQSVGGFSETYPKDNFSANDKINTSL